MPSTKKTFSQTIGNSRFPFNEKILYDRMCNFKDHGTGSQELLTSTKTSTYERRILEASFTVICIFDNIHIAI